MYFTWSQITESFTTFLFTRTYIYLHIYLSMYRVLWCFGLLPLQPSPYLSSRIKWPKLILSLFLIRSTVPKALLFYMQVSSPLHFIWLISFSPQSQKAYFATSP